MGLCSHSFNCKSWISAPTLQQRQQHLASTYWGFNYFGACYAFSPLALLFGSSGTPVASGICAAVNSKAFAPRLQAINPTPLYKSPITKLFWRLMKAGYA
jgi:hypothetical protein